MRHDFVHRVLARFSTGVWEQKRRPAPVDTSWASVGGEGLLTTV